MKFSAHLKIEGDNSLHWIKEKENEGGLIELRFDTEEGEILLQFDPECFDTLVWMVQRFIPKSEKIVKNRFHSKGRVKANICLG